MKSILLIIAVLFVSSSAFAQSAREYVELVCGSKAQLQKVYPSDPIEDVLASKTKEIKFWNNRIEDTLKTVEVLEKGGMDAAKSEENIDATIAVLKACKAYFEIEPEIKKFLQSNKCVDAKDADFDFENVGRTCNLLADPGTAL